MPELETDGVRTYYEESGSGPPLVLVHGLGASSALWSKVVPALAEEFHVVAYDLRGSGRTPATGAMTLGRARRRPPPPGRRTRSRPVARHGPLDRRIGGARSCRRASRASGRGRRHRRPVRASRCGPGRHADACGDRRGERAWRPSRRRSRRTAWLLRSGRRIRASCRRFVSMLEENDPASYAALCRVVAEVDIVASPRADRRTRAPRRRRPRRSGAARRERGERGAHTERPRGHGRRQRPPPALGEAREPCWRSPSPSCGKPPPGSPAREPTPAVRAYAAGAASVSSKRSSPAAETTATPSSSKRCRRFTSRRARTGWLTASESVGGASAFTRLS